MPLELQVFPPTPHSPRVREKTSPFSSQRNDSQFFRVALVWRQGRREERSGRGQAWGGAGARLSLGRPGLRAADMSAPLSLPRPVGFAPLGRIARGVGRSLWEESWREETGARSPFPRRCRLPCPSPRAPAAHTHCFPVLRSLHPALPPSSSGERRRPQEIWGCRGRAGAGGRAREATAAGKDAFSIVSAKKGKSCLLPVPRFCSPRRGTAGP